MSDALSIGNISLGMNDTRNIQSQISIPKTENDDLQALPSSFYPGQANSIEYASPMVDEFAGLGDLTISAEVSMSGMMPEGENIQLPELPGIENIEASEDFEMQALGGAAPPGFEGHGASYRPDVVDPASKIHEMAEQFANI